MKTKKFILLLAVIVLSGAIWAGVAQAQPKNIIFFIGDGMGFEHVKAAGYYAGATLSFESFPYQGELTTYQYGGGIPDSAAAGTSLATGYKVNAGVISMAYPGYPPEYPEGSELPTLLEYFKAQDKRTGLVTTSYMTDATPAAFGAHEPKRGNTEQIADDYRLQTVPNVLFGGGANGMTVWEFANAGYTVVQNRTEMLGLDTEAKSMVSGQFGSTNLPYEFEWSGNLPHLSEMTYIALRILDNDPDGFFLMVEGGLIDKASHNYDYSPYRLERTVHETVEFDNAVQEAIDWAAGRTDTLILVTADHETGGLVVLVDNGAGKLPYRLVGN